MIIIELYGLAILPNKSISQQIINYQNQHLSTFNVPRLSLTHYQPHTSIIQCPFDPNQLTDQLLHKIYNQWLNICHYESNMHQSMAINDSICGIIYQQPINWIFLGIQKQPWMTKLQQIALRNMQSIIDTTQIKSNSHVDQYPPIERHNYLTYGYQYLNTAFRPHITLGHTSNIDLNQINIHQFENQSFMTNLFSTKRDNMVR